MTGWDGVCAVELDTGTPHPLPMSDRQLGGRLGGKGDHRVDERGYGPRL
ncbi:hypothetical protein ABT330_11560 [Streptomyces sp. NPDC000658]